MADLFAQPCSAVRVHVFMPLWAPTMSPIFVSGISLAKQLIGSVVCAVVGGTDYSSVTRSPMADQVQSQCVPDANVNVSSLARIVYTYWIFLC